MRKRGTSWKRIDKYIEFNREMEEGFVAEFELRMPVMLYKYFRMHPSLLKDETMGFLYEQARAQTIKRRFRYHDLKDNDVDRERTIEIMDMVYDMEIEHEPSKIESYAHCVHWCAELLRAYDNRSGKEDKE